MNSLTVEDLSGGGKKRLEGHLRSSAFFGVSDHPQASLNISSMVQIDGDSQILDGELTIKGITHPINFSITFNSKIMQQLCWFLTDQNTMFVSDLDHSLMN